MSEVLESGVLVDDRFELVRKLGSGSTGVVWSAIDRRGDKKVAIKLLHERVFHHQTLVDQLRREIEILETLHHPNIARPIGFSGGRPYVYLAMELVEGPTLDLLLGEHAANDTQLPWEHTLPIVDQLLSAVHHAHQKFIVHRDLKPQNIALASTLRGPEVKVLDFGIAKFLEGGLFDATTLGRRLGSLYYMSPEQLRGDSADLRSDVFALGVMIFEILTLRRAWPRAADGGFLPAFVSGVPRIPENAIATLAVRISSEPRPRASLLRSLPREVDDILMRAMAIDPADRPSSVLELHRSLSPVLARVAGFEPTHIEEQADPTLHTVPSLEIGAPQEGDTRLLARADSTLSLDTRALPRARSEPARAAPAVSYWTFGAIAFASALIVIAVGVLLQTC